MLKLILGLLKGLVVGVAVGYGAFAAGLGGGFHWLTYGIIGALVGLVAGRPLWALITDKEGTTWVSVLKAIFGYGVGVGIYALVAKVWGGFRLDISFLSAQSRLVQDWQPVMGGAIGAFLGAFFEIDDAIGGDDKDKKAAPAAKKSLPAPAGPARPRPVPRAKS
ncbi:MAG TPA: hypothetical protein VHE35_07045 [Kofleriaceae bacterium]|nr:hypothetical protein [Kofleriaceae bacterium]